MKLRLKVTTQQRGQVIGRTTQNKTLNFTTTQPDFAGAGQLSSRCG